MTAIDGNALHVTDRDIDTLTWEFLNFDDAGDERVDGPLDRRLDRFLRDRGLGRLADSADIRNIVLHRAMTNVRVLARQHAQPVAVKCARVYQPPLRLR
ncbi:MAG: hypothetical protein QOE41_1294 [Mycobacterium sp.]|jgi:hypothetical protein|nr:hypothetical protein [Mycobacterium sp.]